MSVQTGGMTRETRLFIACIVALIATAFGFVVRGFLVAEWATEFNLTQGQVGAIQGAGLFPFALSIVFFSLIIDRIGYGRCMAFAFIGHVVSAIITMTANSFQQLYVGTLIFALANGTVEAVINPVTATLFPRSKTHHLNMLHSGWPGGMVLGGLLMILLGAASWRWKIGLFLLPTAVYGFLMIGQKFPIQERVASGVSYSDMLKEFGWGSCFIVSVFVVYALDSVFGSLGLYLGTVPTWAALAIAAVPTLGFAAVYKSFGRPMFVFLLLVMVLLATTELGVDSWITNLMTPVLAKYSQYRRLVSPALYVAHHGDPEILRWSTRSPALAARAARDMRGSRLDRSLLDRECRRRGVHHLHGGDDVWHREGVLLADHARSGDRAVPERRRDDDQRNRGRRDDFCRRPRRTDPRDDSEIRRSMRVSRTKRPPSTAWSPASRPTRTSCTSSPSIGTRWPRFLQPTARRSSRLPPATARRRSRSSRSFRPSCSSATSD